MKGHSNLDMPKTYKTFAELAEYAKQRAKISAARNGHQEFDYWNQVIEWTKQMRRITDDSTPALMNRFRSVVNRLTSDSHMAIWERALYHARAVHMRQMLINRGEKPPRLSLKWLREAAEKL